MVDSHEINRLSSKQPIGVLVQIMAIEDHDQLEPGSDAPELQELLGSFSELFREPTGLPPNRVHDHKIQAYVFSPILVSSLLEGGD